MAIINDPTVAARITQLAQTGTINTDDLLNIVNSVLSPNQQLSSGAGISTGVFKRFGEFDKINAKVEAVTAGMWTSDIGELTTFYTASSQVSNTGDYYYDVYNTNPATNDDAEVQFAVAYGHYHGSGSLSLENDSSSTLASKAIYKQYATTLLDANTNKFQFENSSGIAVDSDSIYVINIARARFREKMDPGNWELKMIAGGVTKTFIDNSGKKFGDTYGTAGRVFKVVEGTLNLGTQSEATITNTTSTSGYGFGLFYPDKGIVVFNPAALTDSFGATLTPTILVDAEYQNHSKLLTAITSGAQFYARRTENISTQHFFARATNREFNYSNNPTFVNTDGSFAEVSFETNPQTYVTTVGLYNDSNEMVAVAKTSQPIPKSYDREILIKVKLSF